MATIPIQSLSPDSDPPSRASIRAVVTLSWPYSSSTRHCALLLADPDFRLRNARGQVRVRFTGPSAEAVAKSHVGIGDDVVLELEGAQWEAAREVDRTPGKSVEGELVFRRRLGLRILGDGGERAVSLDAPASPPPSAETPVPRPLRSLRSSLDGGGYSNGVPIYSSPAFVKRLRLSIESSSFLSDTFYDPFTEDTVESSSAKARQRHSLGEVRQWRFAERTPSPEKGFGLDGPMDVDEHDADVCAAAVRDHVAPAASDYHAVAPLPLSNNHALRDQPGDDTGQTVVDSEGSRPPVLATVPVPALPRFSLPADLMESSSATSSESRNLRGQDASDPAHAPLESAQGQEASGNASAILSQESDKTLPPFRRPHPSYESDTEEDEELYTRTPPRVRSASPSRHQTAQSGSSAALRTTASSEKSKPVAAPTRSGPEMQPAQLPISKPEQSAPQKQSPPTFNATALQAETPTKARTAIFSLAGVSAGMTPLPVLATTPQSEKDRIVSATFKSLFGFRTSPEGQSPPIQPELFTPAPKASWSNMGRKSIESSEPDVAAREIRMRVLSSLSPQHDAAATDKSPHIPSEAKPMPDMWSAHQTPAQGTTEPASPDGTTEADTEADEDLHQPGDSMDAGSRHDEDTVPANSGDIDSRSSQDSSKDFLPRSGGASQTSVPALGTGIQRSTDAIDSSHPPVPPPSSLQSRLPEVIDLDSSSDADQDITTQTETANGSMHMVYSGQDNEVAQYVNRSTEPMFAAPGSAEDIIEDNAVDHSPAINGSLLPTQDDIEMDDVDVVEPSAAPSATDQRSEAHEYMNPSLPQSVNVDKELAVPGMHIVPSDRFAVQIEQAGVPTEADPPGIPPKSPLETMQDHRETVEVGDATASQKFDSRSSPENRYPSLSSPVAGPASKIVLPPREDIDSEPAARREFKLVKFPAERVVEDGQSEQAGTLSIQQTPEATDDDQEPEVIAVPAREQPAGNARDFQEVGEDETPVPAHTSESANDLKPQTSSVEPTVIELGSSSPIEDAQPPEQQPRLQQPARELETPLFSDTNLLEDPDQDPTSPPAASHDGIEDENEESMDRSSTAPMPSEAPMSDLSRAENVEAVDSNAVASSTSQAVTNSVNETYAGSQDVSMAPGSSEEEVVEGAPSTGAIRPHRTNSPEQVRHLPGGMVATFSNSALENGLQANQQPQENEPHDHEDTQLPASADENKKLTDRSGDARPAEIVDQESASAAEQRKMPSRKSLRARLSNVPEVVSAWFSPKSTPNTNAPTSEETNGHTESTTAPTNGHIAALATPPRLTRGQSTGFTTSNGYFHPLASLERYLNPASQTGEVDVLAVVTDFTSAPQRAKAGPRDFYTVFKISDSSLEIDGSIGVEVFRAWKAVLPVAEVGDVVLLRGFVVKSKKRQPYLLSTERSAWCVWKYAELARLETQASVSSQLDGKPHVREEIHGPPVEFGDEERAVVKRLRRWFEETHAEAAKGQAAQGIANANDGTNVRDEGDDEMAYQPMSPGLAARS
ncbi:hypothetical protein EJ03DRAFT_323343 [Teratosphaeria nubilosa]|uniref:Telomeric single stranded DNA binding POT1/Cdc13 domain-containing protein n=1 Tax=Teratosphaeria nubilosa TaxID=161662 RepID=A0A6G1LMA5_9PEZI|nr:hypothetical protein EJ03DRAFT_323343 [Teratosphaeria nubilosa]